jgi:hypothetical protein
MTSQKQWRSFMKKAQIKDSFLKLKVKSEKAKAQFKSQNGK